MSVRVTDNHPKIKIHVSTRTNLALRMALDDIDRKARPNTPYSGAIGNKNSLTGGGHLRDDLLKQVSGHQGTIEWRKEYAVYQERGYGRGPIRNYTTPGTGPHFAEEAVMEVGKNPSKYMKKAGAI